MRLIKKIFLVFIFSILAFIGLVIFLLSYTHIYKNDYGIGYGDPESRLPEELQIGEDDLRGILFSLRSEGRELKCLDGADPEIVPLFKGMAFFLSDIERSAYICGNQYAIYDFHLAQGPVFYGVFDLKDHTVTKIDVEGRWEKVEYKENTPIPEAFLTERQTLDSTFFGEKSSSVEICQNGSPAEGIFIFREYTFYGGKSAFEKRYAFVCNDHYVIEDERPGEGTRFYGPFKLEDHSFVGL